MIMKILNAVIVRSFLALSAVVFGFAGARAEVPGTPMPQLFINGSVTTVITASEPVRFVDISTDKVAGDRPIDNTVRLKPKDDLHAEGELLAIVTIVTERYRNQYALHYTAKMTAATADHQILPEERTPYNNPAVTMPVSEMARLARAVINSPAKFRNVSTKANRMVMRLNNIYAAGDYFFIDFSVDNRTNIRFDIDEIRVKLADRKVSKSTNSQVVELTPAMLLEPVTSFRKGYRNVIVVRKMTFPNDKVLSIEMTEKQISGRSITLGIDYEDVLSADSFNKSLLKEE